MMPGRTHVRNRFLDKCKNLFPSLIFSRKREKAPLLPKISHDDEVQATGEEIARHLKHCTCPLWIWFDTTGISKKVETCLEVAFKPGLSTAHLARRGFQLKVVGCEPASGQEQTSWDGDFIQSDFHSVPEKSASMDMVFADHVIAHSYAPLLALLEWKRIVRRGGYLFVTLPLAIEGDLKRHRRDFSDRADDFGKFSGERASAESIARHVTCGIPEHFFIFTYWQAVNLFKKAGLELVESKIEDIQERKLYDYHQIAKSLRVSNRPRTGLFLLRPKEDGFVEKAGATPKAGRGTGREEEKTAGKNDKVVLSITPGKSSYSSLEESLKFDIRIKNQTRNKITTDLWVHLMKGERHRVLPTPLYGPHEIVIKPKRSITVRCFRTLHHPMRDGEKTYGNNRYTLSVEAGNFPRRNWSSSSDIIRIG